MAAPGTPKALVTPSFSITRTAAAAAVILAMERLPVEIEPAPRRNQFAAALAADARRDRRLMVRGRCAPPRLPRHGPRRKV
jgi:hypothetical protein